ncbi:MAG: cbb3-type cytochrome c oxidase subunit 3 [SAR324 cluster bacterium]|nr:cbb3-type cytochrome c oxidase subunit 3 [SAR324 cluster bacterium]
MFKYILAETGASQGGVISLLIFFALFVFMLFWIFRKGSKEKYDAIAKMPLEAEPQSPNFRNRS